MSGQRDVSSARFAGKDRNTPSRGRRTALLGIENDPAVQKAGYCKK
jgi:hypothetical protein